MTPIDWREHFGGDLEGARVLVTGGAGFIGSHLTEALARLGADVCVLDDLSGGERANLEPFAERVRFVEGSILDEKKLSGCIAGRRWVFHHAALGSVPRSVEEPRRYHEVNTTGTLNVLEAARSAGVERVVFAASSSAYGDSEALPKVETMPVQARSPYAATKAAGEALMRAYAACYDIDAASLRYFNIFGPRQNANSAYAAVIAAFADALLHGRRPVIFGDGEQSRDFTYVDNAVYANLLAVRCETPLDGAVMNIACAQRVTVNQLAKQMAAIAGRPDLTALHEPQRPGDVKHSLAELARAHDLIGYEPVIDFEAGLDATVSWFGSALGAV